MGGWRDGRREKGSRYGRMGGFAKVDNRLKPKGFIKTKSLGYEKWT